VMPNVDCEYDALDRAPDGWLLAYHGTGATHIRRFRPRWGDIGPHFGTPLAANRRAERSFKSPPFDPLVPSSVWESPEAEAERIARTYMNGSVFPVDLNIRNPLRVMDDCTIVPNFMNWYPSRVAERSGIGDAAVLRAAEEREDYDRARRLFIDVAEKLGYDGIVYANEVEGRGGDSLILFRHEQVRFRFQRPISDAE
jgi:hypothetical protein